MPFLEVDSILYRVNDKILLSSISFSGDKGQVVGIFGGNGSGKSSLLKIMFGLLKAENQFIRVDGKVRTTLFKEQNLSAYVPQKNFIPANMRLRTAVKIYLGDNAVFFEDKLLESHTSYKFGELSSGQRRYFEVKLVIERATPIIILDEPFAGLAPLAIDNLLKRISEIKENSCVIIVDDQLENDHPIFNKKYRLNNGILAASTTNSR